MDKKKQIVQRNIEVSYPSTPIIVFHITSIFSVLPHFKILASLVYHRFFFFYFLSLRFYILMWRRRTEKFTFVVLPFDLFNDLIILTFTE